MMKTIKNRYPELDLARTLAILMMVIFHLGYDLEYFYGVAWIRMESLAWILFGRACATLFLLLVGVSFVISWERTTVSHPERSFMRIYPKYLRRGLFILGCGMIVTAATYAYVGDAYVRFGILHVIGTSILLLPFFASLKEWNLVLGILFLASTGIIPSPNPSPFLLPFGYHAPTFVSVDYYPLFPWFGVILIGMAIGNFFYVRNVHWRNSLSIVRCQLSIVCWPGRHALLIYMIHQPILLGILSIIFRKN